MNKINNNVIGVDLDECLAYTLDKLLEDNNNKIGDLRLEIKNIVDYYIYKIPGINLNEADAINLFRNTLYGDEGKNLIQPIEGSYEKLLELKNKGYILKIVTARHEDLSNYTYNWLEQYYPSIFNDVHFAGHFTKGHRNKSEICKEIGAKILIEDNYDYALDVAKCGIKAYLFNKPWNNHINKLHENITRFDSWDGLKI